MLTIKKNFSSSYELWKHYQPDYGANSNIAQWLDLPQTIVAEWKTAFKTQKSAFCTLQRSPGTIVYRVPHACEILGCDDNTNGVAIYCVGHQSSQQWFENSLAPKVALFVGNDLNDPTAMGQPVTWEDPWIAEHAKYKCINKRTENV